MPSFLTNLHFDVDSLTVLVGLLTIPVKLWDRRKRGAPVSSGKTVFDFLNGLTIVPFGLMIGTIVSKDCLDLLIKSEPVYISIAGSVGMVYIIGELLSA